MLYSCNTTPFQSDSAPSSPDTAIATDGKYLAEIKQASVEERLHMLENGHRQFLNLPVDQHTVMIDVLGEIREKRTEPFPDFPERGGTSEETKQRQLEWLSNHPERLAAYLDFLDEQYQYYESKYQINNQFNNQQTNQNN